MAGDTEPENRNGMSNAPEREVRQRAESQRSEAMERAAELRRGAEEMTQRIREARAVAETLVETYFAEDEIRELAPFTAVHEQALSAFIRASLGNQVFIRQAYAEGGEFLLRKSDGKFHRVTFL